MARPDWLDKDPEEWPQSARVAYGLLIRAVLRRLGQERERRDGSQPVQPSEIG